MKKNSFLVILLLLVLSGGGYWYYNNQQELEKEEKQLRLEEQHSRKEEEQLRRVEFLKNMNKSLKYMTEKISFLKKIDINRVTIFYIEYLKYFKNIEFNDKKEIVSKRSDDYEELLEELFADRHFEAHKVFTDYKKYDFVLFIENKYNFSKKEIYEMMSVIDKEENIYDLYDKIWKLNEEKEELEIETYDLRYELDKLDD